MLYLFTLEYKSLNVSFSGEFVVESLKVWEQKKY